MSNILKTTKPIDHHELTVIIEKAYRVSKNDFSIEYDKKGLGTIIFETHADKAAGLSLDVSRDGMKAYLSLFPPLNYGQHIENEAVEDFLLDERGLDTELIHWDVFKECFDNYQNGFLIYQDTIAEGIEKVDGRDASFELHFELSAKKPKELADGSVDFKDINNIVMVEVGDELLTYQPETDGIDGKTVTGNELPSIKGKKINIHKGNGVIFDEETNIYFSSLAGHVTFKGNRLNVNPIYSVNGDVDYSEGNIEFHGTVKVAGDVLSGFEIRAKNIIIWGVARDATLIAEEDISVKTGIFSTGKGMVKAGNTVTASFFEGAEIHAGVAVIVKDYCYNSKIFCEGEILALSGDGVINGGELHAYSSIEAKQIGMDNSASFTCHVGVKYFLNDRIDQLIAQKSNIEKRLKETDKTIRELARSNPDLKKKEQLKSIIANRSTLYEKYNSIDSEIEQLINTSMHPLPYVMAKDVMSEGIKIVIYNTELIVPEKSSSAKYVFHKNTGNIIRVDAKENLEYDPKKG